MGRTVSTEPQCLYKGALYLTFYILKIINARRLKRCWPLDLQDTWGDFAGWIPNHVIVIHGIVAYLYNHHINL